MQYPDWYIRELVAVRKANEAWLKRKKPDESDEAKPSQAVLMKKRLSSYCPASLDDLQQIIG